MEMEGIFFCMNILFGLVALVGLVLLAVRDPQNATSTLLAGTQDAVQLALRLVGVYALWMGILRLASQCGLDRGLAKLYNPLLRRLFRGESAQTISLVGLNLTANLLGLGAAATPVGIRAMESMSRGKEEASDNMILFFVLNVTSVQLVPGTVVALRAQSGSASSAYVLLPTLLCSVLTAAFGVGLCLLCRRLSRRHRGAHLGRTYGAKRAKTT